MPGRPTALLETDVGPKGPLLERYVGAQLAGDRRAALRVVVDEGLGRGVARTATLRPRFPILASET